MSNPLDGTWVCASCRCGLTEDDAACYRCGSTAIAPADAWHLDFHAVFTGPDLDRLRSRVYMLDPYPGTDVSSLILTLDQNVPTLLEVAERGRGLARLSLVSAWGGDTKETIAFVDKVYCRRTS